MISLNTLDALQDDELRSARCLIDEILQKRDEARKAKAIEEARATLAAAGLSFKDLNGKGRAKTAKGPIYKGGQTYQHPSNKGLTWNAKGKKPGWLVELESKGQTAVALA